MEAVTSIFCITVITFPSILVVLSSPVNVHKFLFTLLFADITVVSFHGMKVSYRLIRT